MRTLVFAIAIALVACGGSPDAGQAGGSAISPSIAACPPGSLPAPGRGGCVVVITPQKVAAVQLQRSRIDELGSLLDKVDTLGAPIELLNGFRSLAEWKALVAHSEKLQIVDQIVEVLAASIKQLRAYREHLAASSHRLGDLRGLLDELVAGTGAARSLDDARAQVSQQVRDLAEPYARDTADTIQRALTPLVAQLADVADLVRGACTMAKLSGGSDHLKELCGKANDTFQQALVYLEAVKARPAAVFDELTVQLLSQLDALLDDGTKAVLAAAQKQVDGALDLSATAGSGSGSIGSDAHLP